MGSHDMAARAARAEWLEERLAAILDAHPEDEGAILRRQERIEELGAELQARWPSGSRLRTWGRRLCLDMLGITGEGSDLVEAGRAWVAQVRGEVPA